MDDIVRFSNTPIFNQLQREMGYNPKFPPHLTRPHVLDLPKPTEDDEPRGYMAPGAWRSKDLSETSVPVRERNARLKVNFHPLEVEELEGGVQQFIEERKAEFFRKHPNAVDVTMTHIDEVTADGSHTLLIEGYENTGVDITKRPDWSMFSTEETRKTILRDWGRAEFLSTVADGLVAKMQEYEAETRSEFKTTTDNDTARQQLEVYKSLLPSSLHEKMDGVGLSAADILYGRVREIDRDTIQVDIKPDIQATYEDMVEVVKMYSPKQTADRYNSAVESMKNTYGPTEQTDESVNAALTEDTHPQIPRPLWISDEEVADEE